MRLLISNMAKAASVAVLLIVPVAQAWTKPHPHMARGGVTAEIKPSPLGWPKCYATNANSRPVTAFFAVNPTFSGNPPTGPVGPMEMSGGETLTVYSWSANVQHPTCDVKSVTKH